MTRRFKPPVFATGRGKQRRWTLNIDEQQRSVIAQLLGELRALLASDDVQHVEATSPLLQRLFPRVYTDDEDQEKEAEYQRLMREELVTSRLHQIDAVDEILRDTGATLDEGRTIALMQSINAVRVVLGTMLDVGEEDELEIDDDDEFAGERHLYGYLSWLLDWTVRSLQP